MLTTDQGVIITVDYKIEKDRLVITVDKDDQVYLQEQQQSNDKFDSGNFMFDLFEHLTCNSELQWIPDGVTGDLTSAPMLGICGEVEEAPADRKSDYCGDGLIFVGHYGGKDRVQPVLHRWAFMKYALTSPQRELAEYSQAIFEGGELLHRDGQMHCTVVTETGAIS